MFSIKVIHELHGPQECQVVSRAQTVEKFQGTGWDKGRSNTLHTPNTTSSGAYMLIGGGNHCGQ